VRSFRSRPVGWRSESYRHYLASKGVSTRKYLSKGNFLPSYYKKAFAEGLTREEFERKLFAAGRDDLVVREPEKRTVIDRIIEQPLPDAVPQEDLVGVPVPEERMVPEEQMVAAGRVESPPEEPVEVVRTPGRTVMTPGVPSSPSVGFNIL
jgi:hypothetical protein